MDSNTIIKSANGFDPNGNKIVKVETIIPLQKLKHLKQCQSCHEFFNKAELTSQHCLNCLNLYSIEVEPKHKKH